MRRLEKMEMEKETHDLKVAESRSTCEECEEYDHVQGDCSEEAMVLDYMRKGEFRNFRYGQGKLQFNASASIQNPVPICIQLKDFMDEQSKINKDAVTKFKSMDKILENRQQGDRGQKLYPSSAQHDKDARDASGTTCRVSNG
jgi:hypothetical protein